MLHHLFAAERLPEIIHGRARLVILAYLTTVGHADFVGLREVVAISDGNLSQHLKKLQDGGIIALHKSMVASRTKTVAELTPQGRSAFYDYLQRLRGLIDAVPPQSDIPAK